MSGLRISVATLVAVGALAACGDGHTVAPDAPPGTGDERGLVSVQLLADRTLSGSADVFFQRPDGSLALATRTDGDGRANALVPPGGTVTMGVRTGSVYWVYTYVGVPHGETIVLDLRRSPERRTFQIRIPREAGALSYSAHAACDGYTTAASIPGGDGYVDVELLACTGPTDLLVLSQDLRQGIGYLFTQVLPSESDIDLLGGTYAPYRTSNVSVRAPASFATALLNQRVGAISLGTAIELEGGAGTAQVQLPLAPGATLVTRVDLWGPDLVPQSSITWGPVTTRTDLEQTTLLRPFTAVPAYDVARQTLRWTEGETGEPGDVVAARLEYHREATDMTYRWTIIAPRGAEPEVRFPVLPRSDLSPRADDAPTPIGLALIALDGGYDRLRPRLLGRWRPQEAWPLDAPSGAVLLQAWGNF